MNDEIKARLSHALEHAERRGSALESHVSVLKSDVRALLADGGKGEAVCDRIVCWHNRRCVNDDAATMRNCPHRTAPQAEYAPREAQPWRAENVGAIYDGTFDTTCAHCGGSGCFACLKSAAPTPERADAEKDAALTDEQIEHEIEISGGYWVDGEFRIDCKDLMTLCRAILAENKETQP
jgi:hypothetical protein